VLAGTEVPPGTRADLALSVAESYTGHPTSIPVAVLNGVESGPRMFVTAAVHGDELNGLAVCRELLDSLDPRELRGVLVVVPLVNVLGAQLHSRYLPDRRDLNRSFPGSTTGSLAARLARTIIDEVVVGSDVGVDLHTAANRRANVPQLRIDTSDPRSLELAIAFGARFVLDAAVRPGSLRETARAAGVTPLVYEGGETLRFEPHVVRVATHGVLRLLHHLGMRDIAPPPAPTPPLVMHESRWIRAERGGILDMHVSPGDQVEVGQPLWSATSPLGLERTTVKSSYYGYVVGGTTLPLVAPGDAVLHIAIPGDRAPLEDDPTDEEDVLVEDAQNA